MNALGIDYQQKFLRMEAECKNRETQIGRSGNHWFYYEVNPFYVDVLDKKVISAFIEKIYEPYYDRYGNELEGFFTDEPQIAREGIPWSFVFEEEYRKRYQDDIKNHAISGMHPCGERGKCSLKIEPQGCQCIEN